MPVLCVGNKNSAAFFGRKPSCGPTASTQRASLFVGVKIHVDHCLPEYLTGLGCSFLFFVLFCFCVLLFCFFGFFVFLRNPKEAIEQWCPIEFSR